MNTDIRNRSSNGSAIATPAAARPPHPVAKPPEHGRAGEKVAVTSPADDRLLDGHLELVRHIAAANTKVRDGRAEEAVSDYQRLLETHPGQPAVWFGLAGAWREQGESDKATACLERAVALRPAFADYLRHLGEAYRDAGRLREAVEAFAKAVRIDPRYTESLLYLAISTFQLGDMANGKIWLAKAFRTAARRLRDRIALRARATILAGLFGAAAVCTRGDGPLAFRVWRGLGDYDLKHRRFVAAEDRFRKALDYRRDDVEALLGLGRSLIEMGQTLEALSHLRKAASLKPENARILAALGIAYFRCNEIESAFESLHQALALAPDAARANRFMGWTLLRMEDPEAAREHFERCLSVDRGCADAAFGISQSFQNLGDFGASNGWLQRTLCIQPDHAGGLLMLVQNDRTKRDRTTLMAVEKLLEKEGRSARERIHTHFAAGIIEDDLGNVDRAFEHYEAANSLKDVTCDIDALSERADGMIRIFPKAFFQDRLDFGLPDERPVFIVGMPRSGSTLVEQILASHPDVTGGGELYHLPNRLRAFRAQCPADISDPDYLTLLNEHAIRTLAHGYLEDLQRIGPESRRISDKMLFNFWNLGVIALALPKARIIHTLRDPLDCCTSIYLRDFAGAHAYAYNQMNLGRYFHIYQKLMDHWREALPIQMLEVQYETMIAEPTETIRRILEYCGLDWHENCQVFYKTKRTVSTSSYAQVRQPIYVTAVGKWKRYDKHLDALKAALFPDQTSHK